MLLDLFLRHLQDRTRAIMVCSGNGHYRKKWGTQLVEDSGSRKGKLPINAVFRPKFNLQVKLRLKSKFPDKIPFG